MELLEVLLWIVVVLALIGAVIGILAFFGLRKLWRSVSDSSDRDGRPGPGRPPLSRRRGPVIEGTAREERAAAPPPAPPQHERR